MPKLLGLQEITRALDNIPDWELDGKLIRRAFRFPDFITAIEFVNDVAEVAEEMGHHPDIAIQYNRVLLTVFTHSKGGLTTLDFTLAERIDAIPE
jgi:4a-hydroxytetrahydrobiopterin dehydratase